jgi:hypothetical protein
MYSFQRVFVKYEILKSPPPLNTVIERHGLMLTTPASYSGGPGFSARR